MVYRNSSSADEGQRLAFGIEEATKNVIRIRGPITNIEIKKPLRLWADIGRRNAGFIIPLSIEIKVVNLLGGVMAIYVNADY